MNEVTKVVGVLAVIAGILISMTDGKIPLPSPSPPIEPSIVVPDDLNAELDLAFRSDRAGALKWSGLLAGIARFIEADGNLSSPLVKNLYDVNELRKKALAAPVEPIRGGDAVGLSLAPRLKSLGSGPEKLDPLLRSKVVGLFLQASEALKR